MRAFSLNVLVIALSLVCPVACSVKADRAECPLLLHLSVDGGDEDNMLAYLVREGEPPCLLGSLTRMDGRAECDFEIPRGKSALAVFSGIHSCSVEESGVVADSIGTMDDVFAFSADLDSDSELICCRGTLHRQTAFLHLRVVESSEKDYPFEIGLRSNSLGISFEGLAPISGDFLCRIHPLIGEDYRVCLPRQRDDSLVMEFFEKTKATAVDSIPLGELIAESGYDWTAVDLGDIFVDIDFRDISVSVNVLPWDQNDIIP